MSADVPPSAKLHTENQKPEAQANIKRQAKMSQPQPAPSASQNFPIPSIVTENNNYNAFMCPQHPQCAQHAHYAHYAQAHHAQPAQHPMQPNINNIYEYSQFLRSVRNFSQEATEQFPNMYNGYGWS
ncbi:uncharacterized protein LOC142977927 [Anticarsia gemmatalis]|uniref:uncharacterized protein LOC142977927 n=1 Tax=Anticarsia gemmatalis TaxID=129554 RepID=UPI003F76139B